MNILQAFSHNIRTAIDEVDDCIQNITPVQAGTFIVSLANGSEFIGVKQMKIPEGQQRTLTVPLQTKNGHPTTNYQKGSSKWTIEGEGAEDFELTVHEDNELSADVKCLNGENNSTAIVTNRVDGDPDDDNDREIITTGTVETSDGEAFISPGFDATEPVDTIDTPATGDGGTAEDQM